MLQSHTDFQPLKTCVVGRSYPPEFYSFIENPRLRSLFEKIAVETEEDFQSLIKKLEEFNVKVIRPKEIRYVPAQLKKKGLTLPSPYSMVPRDQLAMIGNNFYEFGYDIVLSRAGLSEHLETNWTADFYNNIKGERWPEEFTDYDSLSADIKNELLHNFNFEHKSSIIDIIIKKFVEFDCWQPIIDFVKSQGNTITTSDKLPLLRKIAPNGIVRLGKDLLIGIDSQYHLMNDLAKLQEDQFKDYRCRFVESDGHVDGCLGIVKPGLLLTINDMDDYDYKKNFPGWEIVSMPGQSWQGIDGWIDLKKKNLGKWWIQGYERDNELIDFVEDWFSNWMGYVEETVFDVNILSIDEKNVFVTNYNKAAFDAFERHGVTPHIIPWRHRYFWDGGLHCITCDIDRDGECLRYL